MNTTTEIRSQADMAAFFRSIGDDFDRLKWDDWMVGELRRMEAQHAEYFARQAGPDGAGWAPNRPSTIKRKGHARILRGIPRDGHPLSKSLTLALAEFAVRYTIDEWPSRAQLIFGTDAPHHGYNQDGTSRAPARPHVGVTLQYFDGMVGRAADHALKGLKR